MLTPRDANLLVGGTYARKQIFCRSRLVAWTHRSRFALARRLVTPAAGSRLLDYGCGDGTFLGLVYDLFPAATGADADPSLVAECAARFAALPNLAFLETAALATATAAFDVVVCMEVLEHCLRDERRRVLSELRRLLVPGGLAIISMPIETGPSLVAKQLVRAVAGWRGLGDYRHRETYGPRELLRMVFAGPHDEMPRVALTSEVAPGRTLSHHGHKGFNWRIVAEEIARLFHVERRLGSPLSILGPWANTQVWLVCRPR